MNRRAFRAMGLDDEATMDPAPVLSANINMTPRTVEELEESVKLLKERCRLEKVWLATSGPELPILPSMSANATNIRKRLKAMSNFIRGYEYNHIGKDFFTVDKKKPLSSTMEVAKQILREALPMKCLEAVAVSLYLTRDLPIVRLPLRFQTAVDSHTFWHIVCAVQLPDGKFGALGISRRPTLDFRDMTYNSLSQLTLSYIEEYSKVGHTVCKITVGLPFGTKEFSQETVYWCCKISYF
jgi:hypothetical protein